MARTSTLEASLLKYLKDKLPSNFKVSPRFYRKKMEVSGNDVLVTIGYLSDGVEGKIISEKILHPIYTISIFSADFMLTRKAQEYLLDLFSETSPNDIKMENQYIQSFFRVRRLPVVYDEATNLSVGGIDYKFLISSL